MKPWVLVLFCSFSWAALGQNPDGFEKMAKKMEGNRAPIITRSQLIKELEANEKILLLDSRETNEFEVSHLPNAKYIGFKNQKLNALKTLDKQTKIVVYCSVGYRSGKTVEKLMDLGFMNVYNLHGGIFDWANNTKQLENKKGQPTKSVHGYNEKWSKYLNDQVVKPVID